MEYRPAADEYCQCILCSCQTAGAVHWLHLVLLLPENVLCIQISICITAPVTAFIQMWPEATLSACCIYSTLFGRSAEGINYYPAINGKTSAQSQQIEQNMQSLAADVALQWKPEYFPKGHFQESRLYHQ